MKKEKQIGYPLEIHRANRVHGTWLAGLCFVVGIKWLIGLSIALFAIPLWGLISHRRWCRAHNEPYANWELFYTVIAWIVYIFITLVIYFHFFT